MPRGGPCDHRRCDGDCRMLTEEELTPSPEDLVLARQLVADGWLSTSTRYRHVSRVLPGYAASDLLKPEMLATPAGKLLAEAWEQELRWALRSSYPFVEHKTLTVKQYAAFRAAGGQTA